MFQYAQQCFSDCCTRLSLLPRNRQSSLCLDVHKAWLAGQSTGVYKEYSPRKRRRLSCRASDQSEETPPTRRSIDTKLRTLRTRLQEAVKAEEYAAAAAVRDEIKELESNDPIENLKVQLKEAISQQKFEEAARCRDELKKLVPEPVPRAPSAPPPPTLSDTTTNGVRIQVKSSFLPHRSRPGSYVFMYRVRISNESKETTVKLHSRHWIITDANSYQDNVKGLGVIGEFPELAPGEEHIYGSFAPIRTPTGKMRGTFHMQICGDDGSWKEGFDAEIGVFGLDMSDATPAKW